MVEENFVFQSLEMLQNEGLLLGFSVNSFIMVEENFEFQSLKMLQKEVFSLTRFNSIASPRLKKIWKFQSFEMFRMKYFL